MPTGLFKDHFILFICIPCNFGLLFSDTTLSLERRSRVMKHTSRQPGLVARKPEPIGSLGGQGDQPK
jgi:hypothetical protein